jgi:hypothetical protein
MAAPGADRIALDHRLRATTAELRWTEEEEHPFVERSQHI